VLRGPVLEILIFSTLNGVLYSMVPFMLASGLTLIFSMMGVLNAKSLSFIEAFKAYQL
jgi:branched-chain amino acid transport system permease protein